MTLSPVQSTGQFLLRSLIPAFIVLVEIALEGEALTPRRVFTAFLAGWLLSVIVCDIARRLSWPAQGRFAVIWFLLFIVRGVNILLEGYFFSTQGLPSVIRSGAHLTISSLVLAAAIAWLFPPARTEGSVGNSVRWLLSKRAWYSWVWRLAVGVVTYVFVYFLFGGIAFQFTKPYYTDPSYGLNLTLPSAGLVFKLQFLRGFTFFLASFFVLAGLKESKWKQAWLMGLALFILGGLSPLVSVEQWPVALRFYHTVEIFFQNFTNGVVLALLIGIASSAQEHVSGGRVTEKS